MNPALSAEPIANETMHTKIPAEFWADLKTQKLIEQNAPVSQLAPAGG
jgi:hypothetical protein